MYHISLSNMTNVKLNAYNNCPIAAFLLKLTLTDGYVTTDLLGQTRRLMPGSDYTIFLSFKMVTVTNCDGNILQFSDILWTRIDSLINQENNCQIN